MKTTTMKPKRKITTLRGLRKEKARLALQIEQEQLELRNDFELLKESFWPIQIVQRFRKTAESVSENRFFVIGAQLAYAILQAAGKRNKNESASSGDHSVLDFLKQAARSFIEFYTKKEDAEKEDET